MLSWRIERVWDDLEDCEELAITIDGRMSSFQEFVATASKAEVIEFWSSIVQLLQERGVRDYHMVLRNHVDSGDDDRGRGGHRHHSRDRSRPRSPRRYWKITVYHGGEARPTFSGPITANTCMSCDITTSMMTGLSGSGDGGLLSLDSLIYEDDLMRYWHDAKGRSMFVVTPRRHVRALDELTGDELYQLWGGAVQIMQDMGCRHDDLKDMILNAGVDQNHAHLHLKIRIHRDAFDRARATWSKRRQRVVRQLRDFADSRADKS